MWLSINLSTHLWLQLTVVTGLLVLSMFWWYTGVLFLSLIHWGLNHPLSPQAFDVKMGESLYQEFDLI